MTEEQFFKLIGVKPFCKVKAGSCPCERCNNPIKEIYPVITAKHIFKLEELIKSPIRVSFENCKESFMYILQIPDKFNRYKTHTVELNNRQESLLSVIYQLINSNILTKEEIKAVFE